MSFVRASLGECARAFRAFEGWYLSGLDRGYVLWEYECIRVFWDQDTDIVRLVGHGGTPENFPSVAQGFRQSVIVPLECDPRWVKSDRSEELLCGNASEMYWGMGHRLVVRAYHTNDGLAAL